MDYIRNQILWRSTISLCTHLTMPINKWIQSNCNLPSSQIEKKKTWIITTKITSSITLSIFKYQPTCKTSQLFSIIHNFISHACIVSFVNAFRFYPCRFLPPVFLANHDPRSTVDWGERTTFFLRCQNLAPNIQQQTLGSNHTTVYYMSVLGVLCQY